MSRNVTAGMQTASQAVPAYPILLWEGLFDAGALRLWTGYGTLSWDGKSWEGAGDLLAVDPASELTQVIASGSTFRLNGVPSDLIALALAENYQGRPCSLWLGMLASGAVVGDPIKIFAGRMDVMELDDSGDTGSIVLTAENALSDLNRAPSRHYTDEDQKADFPTDEGLAFVPTIQEREVIWK